MRFSCDSCQARYTIADEKVRGKLVRVTCKRCGSTILLREQTSPFEDDEFGVSHDEPTHVLPSAEVRREIADQLSKSTAPPPTRADKPLWYAAINQVEVGPLTEAELQTSIVAGDVTLRTYVWRDGMANWARVRDLPSLAAFVQAAPAILPPAPPIRQRSQFSRRTVTVAAVALATIVLVVSGSLWAKRKAVAPREAPGVGSTSP